MDRASTRAHQNKLHAFTTQCSCCGRTDSRRRGVDVRVETRWIQSRRDQDPRQGPPAIAKRQRFQRAVSDDVAADTVIDGEVVALNETGRPSFNTLQNLGSTDAPILYYVFDVMVLAGRNVMVEPLTVRREPLKTKILPKLDEPIRDVRELQRKLSDLIEAVRGRI